MSEENGYRPTFSRGTGLLVLEVRFANPNGDPDAESEPRMLDGDGRGLISPPSFKRKLRDLVSDKDGDVWALAKQVLQLEGECDKRMVFVNTRSGVGRPTQCKEVLAKYNVLETRFRERDQIMKMKAAEFAAEFWDARVFGNTFLEQLSEEENEGEKASNKKERAARKSKQREERDHFISTGVVQFGPGISVAPILPRRDSNTSKAGVQGDKTQGMAPLGWRVVRHAVYAMPFFVNPMMARKNGCGARDIELMKFVIPHAYRCTASTVRAFVEVRHAWYAEHKSPLGSCPDSLILDALTPKKIKGGTEEPSTSIDEYEIPQKLPDKVSSRLECCEDLCAK